MSSVPKRVLIAPLDWGLGHATRCVPVIRAFREAGAEVILAADGHPKHFFRQEFPELECITLRGYDITYPRSSRLAAHLLLAFPRIRSRIREEHERIRRFVAEKKIDIVVSDNRFGLYGSGAYSIYITHQLRVKARSGGLLATRIHQSYIDLYDEVWIPDAAPEQENFSGDLAHGLRQTGERCLYTGPLSRFSMAQPSVPAKKYELVIMLSGPEPQRSMFEEILLEQLPAVNMETLLLRGKPSGDTIHPGLDHVTILPHLDTPSIAAVLAQQPIVVSRSGYSTLCDLAHFGNRLIAVPTPGQPEQEYLARLHQSKGKLLAFSQSSFELAPALENAQRSEGFSFSAASLSNQALFDRIQQLLQKK